MVMPVTAPPEMLAVPVAVGPEIACNVDGVYISVVVAPVAFALSTNVVPLVIEAIVVPGAIPAPETDIPATKPVVLGTVTFFEPFVVVTPDVNLPPAVAAADNRMSAEYVKFVMAPVEVAATSITNWVPLVIEATVALVGMFVPETTMPASRFAVLGTVTVVEPFVVFTPDVKDPPKLKTCESVTLAGNPV